MTDIPVGELTDDLFEDAPCGYLSTLLDGTIIVANRTFERLTGHARESVVGRRTFQEMLPAPGRIYHETHYRPLLLLRGEASEIAVEIVCSDGSRLPVLLNSVVARDEAGEPRTIRTAIFPAVDRRRYEEELLRARRRDREIALQLQRSLLTGSLPTAPGLELAVAYHPGVSGLVAGGDWYDAFWIDEGSSVALVVGDVIGRGIDAAATMGQIRSATRAFTSMGLSPSRVLTALDRYSTTHSIGELTTMVYAVLSVASRTLRYACAGHPPPLLSRPGGPPWYEMDARSLPLGVSAAVDRGEAVIDLAAETTVLLYTDGIVESSSRSLDAGMETLRDVVAGRPDAGAADLAEAVIDELRSTEQGDDRCLLVARLV